MLRINFALPFALALIACEPDPEPEPKVALPIAALSLTPGCYAAFLQPQCEPDPSGGMDSALEAKAALCEEAREANRLRAADVKTALGAYIALSEAVVADPTAGVWQIDYTWPEPHELVTQARLAFEGAVSAAGLFGIDVASKGVWRPSDERLGEMIDGREKLFGFYDQNFALIDLGQSVVRWTAHVLEFGAVYRGCDPEKKISFDARHDDRGVYDVLCWDEAGNVVPCGDVDLWPTQ